MDDFVWPVAQLVPLCRADVRLAPPVFAGGYRGKRIICEVTSVRLTGERLEAELFGHTAADWVTVSPDGRYGGIDVRSTLRTADGAIIYVEYEGRVRFGPKGRSEVFSAPRFETGDERYAWLNAIQAVGRGISDAREGWLRVQVYELV
ncbi:MAG TPA: DUF3237 domain-containing protein [Steroidobacteraceae bacterium]|nr:DUF3237 domain-containing protein [Steroidobacteraceae bacterium]